MDTKNVKNGNSAQQVNLKTKGGKKGEYNEYVGKSLFQMIPEAMDPDAKDNFAALGADS